MTGRFSGKLLASWVSNYGFDKRHRKNSVEFRDGCARGGREVEASLCEARTYRVWKCARAHQGRIWRVAGLPLDDQVQRLSGHRGGVLAPSVRRSTRAGPPTRVAYE